MLSFIRKLFSKLDGNGNGIGRCFHCLKIKRLSGGVCDDCQEYR